VIGRQHRQIAHPASIVLRKRNLDADPAPTLIHSRLSPLKLL